ncbi:leucyl aminopeptidase family protein [Paenibacillus filicis]|uniref:Probable cytosol aminopeptidase n=1 Tax=Paenibacillus gyeongsangnamensis TaxID=3388067 RepID=A0ABT4QAA4_9BACL|nr:leucyl aminopeptidase family protein [Paenibacillus filicis]MCZ8513749.1 leucyl aminopeptidase family protein [Paenibacillus filicis]
MEITISPDRRAGVYVHPVYTGESFEFPLGEERRKSGTVTWFHPRAAGESEVLVVGMGGRGASSLETVRRAGGLSARTLLREGRSCAELVRPITAGGGDKEDAAAWLQAWTEGWLLGLYRFDKYKETAKAPGGVRLNVTPEEWPELSVPELESAVENARIRAGGTALARDLVNEPPEVLHPNALVESVISHFHSMPVRIHVYRGPELAAHQMNGLLAVGSGSPHDPALIEIRYEGDPSLPMLALVGKGITFDMGGMNVKTGRDISDARMDMGGAAAVAGAMDILVRQRRRVNVTALIAVADNLPDANAMLPSSVIRYPNGLTVQVANTDGEGRLILADALLHAARIGAAEAIDIATLTGNVGQALGLGIAGLWGDAEMSRMLVEIGERSGERLWPMPLMEEYESELHSDYADLRNVGTSTLAGAITAALFIRRFVAEPMRWVHIDMAGTVQYKQDVGYSEKGATGYGARLLADYAASHFGNKE